MYGLQSSGRDLEHILMGREAEILGRKNMMKEAQEQRETGTVVEAKEEEEEGEGNSQGEKSSSTCNCQK